MFKKTRVGATVLYLGSLTMTLVCAIFFANKALVLLFLVL